MITDIKAIKEVDIAKPVEKYLEELGYRVRSEVKGCDITAVKDDNLLVVECKKSLSMKLIYQGVDRQEFCDSVYLALPLFPDKKIPNRKHLMKLLKRLELGLITVTFLKRKTRVDIVLDPKNHKKRKRRKKYSSVIKEIEERSGNYNQGGTVRSKLMTAYKERAIEIATLLQRHGSLTSPELKKLGACPKTYNIMYNNFHGWFVKDSGRGKYSISQKGVEAIKEYLLIVEKN